MWISEPPRGGRSPSLLRYSRIVAPIANHRAARKRLLPERIEGLLRHGLGVAGICVGLVLVISIGTLAYEAATTGHAAQASVDAPASSAVDVVRSLINSNLNSNDDDSEASPPVEASAPPASSRSRLTALASAVPVRVAVPFRDSASAVREPEPLASATPSLAPGDRALGTVSFYYCLSSALSARGDGGAFCGAMRDGSIVYNGAAACDVEYLGQRFRVEGDPTGRIYTCADTGSAVHGLHRDIWFYDSAAGWQWVLTVGRRVVIEIVE